MGVAVDILVWTSGAMAVLVGLAVVMPLRLELVVHKDAAWRYHASLRPFGRFGPRIGLSGGARTPKADKPARGVTRHRAPKGSQRMLSAGVHLLRDVLARVRVNHLDVNGRFGLGDPGDTGQVFGALCPVIYGSGPSQKVHVRIEPVFDRVMLSGRAELVLSLIPGALLYPLARFGWQVFGATR